MRPLRVGNHKVGLGREASQRVDVHLLLAHLRPELLGGVSELVERQDPHTGVERRYVGTVGQVTAERRG